MSEWTEDEKIEVYGCRVWTCFNIALLTYLYFFGLSENVIIGIPQLSCGFVAIATSGCVVLGCFFPLSRG